MAKYAVHGYRDELRGRRRKRKIRLAFLIVSSLIVLIWFLTYAFFFSRWFLIKEVRISGNEEISEQEIEDLTNGYLNKSYLLGFIKPFLNILFTSSKSIEHSVRTNFPIIDEVNVNKELFARILTVDIKEREIAGIWCQNDSDKCFYFDKDLVLFKVAPKFSGGVFLTMEDGRSRDFNLADTFDDKVLFEKIILTRDILDEIKTVDYSSFFLPEGSFEFWIKTKEGWYVYLDKENDIPTQLVALKKFLEEKLSATRRQTLQYIDLRVNNRIYYK